MGMKRSRSSAKNVPAGGQFSVASMTTTPSELGVLREDGRLYLAFSDGTRLPYIAGGSVDHAPEPRSLLLTTEEAQAQIKVGKTTMFALLKSGEIKSVRIGRSRRVVASSLREFVEARMADAQ